MEEFQRRFVRARQPVVIRGAIDHWPALQRWSAVYFRERYGASVVPCFTTRDRDLIVDARAGVRMEDAAVDDVLAGSAADALRVRAEISKSFPGLMADLDVPAYCRGGLDLEAFLWITPGGTRTALHWDSPENLFAHVAGEKTFLLVDPAHTARLYPFPLLSATPQFSRVDLGAPDYARFPRLHGVPLVEARLRPGDVLFLPSGWWHYAESATLTFSVNFWWLRPSRVPAAAVVALSKRLFRRPA